MTDLLQEIEKDSDRCYFAGRDFTVPMVHAGGTVNCLFDLEYAVVEGDESEITVHQPVARMHKADLPTLKTGDSVQINSVDYIVRDMQYDTGQTGDVLLVLSI